MSDVQISCASGLVQVSRKAVFLQCYSLLLLYFWAFWQINDDDDDDEVKWESIPES